MGRFIQLIDVYNSPEFNILFERFSDTWNSERFVEILCSIFPLCVYGVEEYEDLFWIKKRSTISSLPVAVRVNPLYLPILKQEGIRTEGMIAKECWVLNTAGNTPLKVFTRK